MVQILAEGSRIARKEHSCFHCGRAVVKGQSYGFQTCKYDHVYTICWHHDCEALANKCRHLAGNFCPDEGWQGLRDDWCDSGEYRGECDNWRGFYPHVIARMELTDQLRVTP